MVSSENKKWAKFFYVKSMEIEWTFFTSKIKKKKNCYSQIFKRILKIFSENLYFKFCHWCLKHQRNPLNISFSIPYFQSPPFPLIFNVPIIKGWDLRLIPIWYRFRILNFNLLLLFVLQFKKFMAKKLFQSHPSFILPNFWKKNVRNILKCLLDSDHKIWISFVFFIIIIIDQSYCQTLLSATSVF